MDDTVLQVAARGWPVFPTDPARKRPLIKDQLHAASADVLQLAQWEREFPRCAWSLVTGAPSTVVVLDLDERPGALSGRETMGELGLGLFLPPTPTVRTPRGGTHHWFRWPGVFVKSLSSRLPDGRAAPGIDIKGDRGSALLPGERTPGRAWEAGLGLEVELAGCPAWMIPPPAAQPSQRDRAAVGEPGWGSAYGIKAIEDEVDRVMAAKLGQQHEALLQGGFRIGQLVGARDVEAAGALRLLDWLGRNLPTLDATRPWREGEARRTLEEAYLAGMRKPRGKRA